MRYEQRKSGVTSQVRLSQTARLSDVVIAYESPATLSEIGAPYRYLISRNPKRGKAVIFAQ